MARDKYVDLDIYGRGFDGIFGPGAEQENKRQALMKFKAMQRFKERVKPGEYIDLDLYGRGDPRIFGTDAHIHTQRQAKKLLEDVQSRKRDGHVNHAIIMFPVGLMAITRKARQLLKRTSSKSSEVSEVENSKIEPSEVEIPVGENVNNDREGATEGRIIPAAGKTQEEKATLEETEINSRPRRFKSKLPSEEVAPYVEPGAVARAVKSISSQDNIEDDIIVDSSRSESIPGPAHISAHSSIAPRGPFPQNESDSVSSKSAESSRAGNPEAASDDNRCRLLAQPVSTRSEAELARDIVVGSDEEFPLSFSTNVQNGDRTDYNSTSSDEDMVVRQPIQERVLVDTEGRTESTGNKIAGLFRSKDSDDAPEERVASEGSSAETGPSETDETYSSTEDEDVSTDEAGEVMEVSPDATGRDDSDAKNDVGQVSEVRGVQPALGPREASIVKVVETGNLLFDNELVDNSNNEIHESVEARAATEIGVADEAMSDNASYEADEEPTNLSEQSGDGLSSSDGSTSREGVRSDERDNDSVNSGYMGGSAYVTDSDRSGEAGSSSVVMSSSPEEDSDDIEFETSGDVEEENEEAGEVEEEDPEEYDENSSEGAIDEETEDYGARVVDSSEAEISFTEDNDATEGQEDEGGQDAEAENPHGEGNEGASFWQRLNFFATVAQGNWSLY